MFYVCIRQQGFVRGVYMPFFYLYVLLYMLLGLGGGYIGQTLTKFIAYFFVSVVAYYSTLLYMKKNEGGYYLVVTLLVLGVVNSIVTTGNMFMMPWATRITDFLHVTNSMDVLEYVEDRNNTDSMDGFAVPGIISDVGNGYFMAYMSILALYSKDKKIHLYQLPLYVLFLLTLFFIQERTALVAGLILSLYVLYRVLVMQGNDVVNKRYFIIVLIVGFIYIAPHAYEYIMNGNSRYATEGFTYSDGRSRHNDMSWEFLTSNPWGGFFDFYKIYHIYPHNLIFNALVYGGFIGGFSIFCLLWKQLSLSLHVIKGKINVLNYDFYFFSLMFIAYNVCSLTHNQSVVTGDPTFWVLWAMCESTWKKKY